MDRTRLAALRISLLLAAGLAGCQDDGQETANTVADSELSAPPALGAFRYVTVGTADLDAALATWRGDFGMAVIATRDGADPALATLWAIEPAQISRQALLRTPGLTTGALHLVEFARPGDPVRGDSQVFDRLPKNLDLYARDLPARYEELLAEGRGFRSRWKEIPVPGGAEFREVQMPGHDKTNIVLLEILGTDYTYGPAGYAAIGPIVIVVGDADNETAFYQDVLGLELIMQDLLVGPELERLVGLPAGAGIDFRILGAEADPMGRIELVEYQRAGGADLFDRARPPATGMLHAGWRTASLASLRRRLEARGIDYEAFDDIDAVFGRGPMIVFRTPAGFRVEVQEAAVGPRGESAKETSGQSTAPKR